MNKQDLIDLAKVLGENAGPQLRTYIYVQWTGWLVFFLVSIPALFLVWKFRAKIDAKTEGLPLALILLGCGGFVIGLLGMCFIGYTAHVFTTPELEALKDLFGK